MDSIHSILNQFTPYERQQVLSFASIRNSPDSKKLKLLRLFLNHPEKEDPFYATEVYGKAKHLAYPQLKKRLKDEIEEVLLLLKPCDQNHNKLNRIHCSKLILRSQLLLARNLKNEGAKLLDKALKKVIEDGLHDLVLSIFSIAQEYEIPEVLSKKDLPDIEFGIKSHLQILANQASSSPIVNISNDSRNAWLKQMLEKLNSNQRNWRVVNLLKQSMEVDIEDAASQLNIMESDFESQDCNTPVYWQFVTTKLEMKLLQRKYEEIANICQSTGAMDKRNQKVPEEFFRLYFIGCFHRNQFEKCCSIIENELVRRYPEDLAIWNYYRATLNFMKQRWHHTIHIIHDSLSNLKAYDNYFLGAKIMEMMVLVEQKDQDWLEYKIDNFRKLLSRRKDKINQRILLSFQLISSLDLLVSPPLKISSQEISGLFDEFENHPWNPLGFEVFRFDLWLKKFTQKNYSEILMSS